MRVTNPSDASSWARFGERRRLRVWRSSRWSWPWRPRHPAGALFDFVRCPRPADRAFPGPPFFLADIRMRRSADLEHLPGHETEVDPDHLFQLRDGPVRSQPLSAL